MKRAPNAGRRHIELARIGFGVGYEVGDAAGGKRWIPGAPHAFNADYRPSYRADAAKDAWARMLAFLKQYDVAGTATRAKAG